MSKIRRSTRGLNFMLIRRFSVYSYLSAVEQPRINPVGIQYLSKKLDKQIFPSKRDSKVSHDDEYLIELSKQYLETHGLLGKKTNISDPISFDIPKLQGSNLDDHFKKLALFSSQNYLENAKKLAEIDLPPKPNNFKFQAGWFKYIDGKTLKVDYPDDNAIIFDVETQYKVSNYAVMAVAASATAWYTWVSPIMTGESTTYEHLIPLNTQKKEMVIVGHNVGYDRARIKEEYSLQETKAFFLDTMSLHIAVSGMCSQQRMKWMAHRKLKNDEESTEDLIHESEANDPWINYSSPNSLAEVSQFYMKQQLDKSVRDNFSTSDLELLKQKFYELISYCADDVLTTHKIYKTVLPEFLEVCPHPVSFAALRHMSSGILPTNKLWNEYIETAERLYVESRQKVESSLVDLAEQAVELRNDPGKFQNDTWLNQLDWTITPLKLTKKGEPYKNQKLPGFPQWYRELYSTKDKKPIITTRSRITPLLLRLQWEDYPVVWHDLYGWSFKAESSDFERLKKKNYVNLPYFEKTYKKTKEEITEMEEKGELRNLSDIELSSFYGEKIKDEFVYFRVPNSVGPEHRTTLLLAKEFSTPFEKSILKSENPLAQEAIKMNSSCSYWISSRERIMSQFVVPSTEEYSLIIPQVLTMGTVTRRAVEKTWLTASNAKKSRIGSELKSRIIAPPGYCFVGADVDSEELWIASLVGDSMFKLHGGTAIGWMTLEGSKNEGTDLHSKTANILGISRNEAKVFNYGRIYGAGVKFASVLLKKFNPQLTQEECAKRAKALYAETKGQSGKYYSNKQRNKIWFGGSESVLFNELERIAHKNDPKTPVLGASITKALKKSNLNLNSFLPSRVNWAIQSSGVDYLHLLCVSMNYLITKYSIHARLALSVHDEIRYLVKEEDRYRAARALQISNLWTRGIFSENLGMNDLPQSCAFFSAVDIDHVLRKEVDMDCITPSNPIAISPGQSLDIRELLNIPESELGESKRLGLSKIKLSEIENFVEKSDDVSNSMDNFDFKKALIQMQVSTNDKDFKKHWNRFKSNEYFKRNNEFYEEITKLDGVSSFVSKNKVKNPTKLKASEKSMDSITTKNIETAPIHGPSTITSKRPLSIQDAEEEIKRRELEMIFFKDGTGPNQRSKPTSDSNSDYPGSKIIHSNRIKGQSRTENNNVNEKQSKDFKRQNRLDKSNQTSSTLKPDFTKENELRLNLSLQSDYKIPISSSNPFSSSSSSPLSEESYLSKHLQDSPKPKQYTRVAKGGHSLADENNFFKAQRQTRIRKDTRL
ncbi:hypothetical protein WICMUC_000479 [Wickerhamomyces mucosus]|uniref:DNA polymerase gamma n=1 Tax=Wickerhamomyces mucosus TaxID=1378264 RepID=A0A9P8PZR8_9ASCO|nr:hypothetical protein WICMUC_000479 [Wickerhamomyces mucosus]